MVNFDNEATVGTPRADILTVLVLQRRNDAINAFEHYNKLVGQGADPPITHLRASVLALFLEFRAALQNGMPEQDYKKVLIACTKGEAEQLSQAFMTIDDWLYKKNITKIDSRKSVDTADIEANNDKDYL